MRIATVPFTLLLLAFLSLPAWPADQVPAVAEMRSQLAELGGFVIAESEGRGPKPSGPPYKRTPSEQSLYQLARSPREPVREAIDQALKNGTKQERIGALTLYNWIVPSSGSYFPKEPLNPAYEPLLYDLLAKDDLKMPAYTGSVAGTLWLYPISREVILVHWNIAEHAPNPKMHEDYLMITASRLGLDLGIHTRTTPLEKQKILADFEAWFAKNEKYIEFDEKGRSLLAGSKVKARPGSLSTEDRTRIRKDPVCVLRLMQVMIGEPSTEEHARELVKQCGEALYGVQGAKLVAKGFETSNDGSEAAMDLQLASARAQGTYPVVDAVVLAVAYVAAYDTDQADRELAKTTLDQFGSPDIPRVLKGEPKVVHEKLEALGDEALGTQAK